MPVTLDYLAQLPGMPSAGRLRSMVEELSDFPAEPIRRLPGRFIVADPLAAIRFVLERYPADEPQRRFSAAMRIGTLAQLCRIPGLPSLRRSHA